AGYARDYCRRQWTWNLPEEAQRARFQDRKSSGGRKLHLNEHGFGLKNVLAKSEALGGPESYKHVTKILRNTIPFTRFRALFPSRSRFEPRQLAIGPNLAAIPPVQ